MKNKKIKQILTHLQESDTKDEIINCLYRLSYELFDSCDKELLKINFDQAESFKSILIALEEEFKK